MKKNNLDQQIRLALWPILAVIFVNTFGMLWYSLSGTNITLASQPSMVVSFDLVFRVALLAVSLVVGYFVYDQQQKRSATEFTKSGAYNMRGKGSLGFVMHLILGLVEAMFAFFTLNAFWLIVNFSDEPISQVMQQVYWLGFGVSMLVAAYFLTRQLGLGVLASRRR